MQRILTLLFFFFLFAVLIGGFFWFRESKSVERGMVESAVISQSQVTPSVSVTPAPRSFLLPQSVFISQSFNNCGPATLSMVMTRYGKQIDQETLANEMRPFHNPAGGVDDKSIFAEEFVHYAKTYGFEALERPNGDIELIKKLVANGVPVIVRTWLHPGEDIGHFRIVRGYNDTTQTLVQDDSYQGPGLSYSYAEFLSMWQPFNYGYILVYPKEKEAVVATILGDSFDQKNAYQNSIVRAKRELEKDTSAIYPYFNLSTAEYHLGHYQASLDSFEKVASLLPSRMLWYQIEPIQAYEKVGNDEKVFELTDQILNKGNKAYSELYQMRGEVYLREGKIDAAREEFENAVYFNSNFIPAQEAIKKLNDPEHS